MFKSTQVLFVLVTLWLWFSFFGLHRYWTFRIGYSRKLGRLSISCLPPLSFAEIWTVAYSSQNSPVLALSSHNEVELKPLFNKSCVQLGLATAGFTKSVIWRNIDQVLPCNGWKNFFNSLPCDLFKYHIDPRRFLAVGTWITGEKASCKLLLRCHFY